MTWCTRFNSSNLCSTGEQVIKDSSSKTKNSQQPKIKNANLVKKKLEKICQAAEELFSEKGYHKTTIRDITTKSGISIGSIYDYINNKEDILFLVIKEFFTTLRTEIDRILKENLDVLEEFEAVFETMVRVVERYQEYTLFTYRDSKYLKKEHLNIFLEQERYFINVFENIIKRGMQNGIFRKVEPEIVANTLTIITHSWALKRYSLNKFSIYSFHKTNYQIILRGLLAENKHSP